MIRHKNLNSNCERLAEAILKYWMDPDPYADYHNVPVEVSKKLVSDFNDNKDEYIQRINSIFNPWVGKRFDGPCTVTDISVVNDGYLWMEFKLDFEEEDDLEAENYDSL